jgi:porin
MKRSIHSMIYRAARALSAAAMLWCSSTTLADNWPQEVLLTSHDSGCTTTLGCGGCDGSAGGSSDDGGYWLSGICDTSEFNHQFMSAAQSMAERGIVYAPVVTQFYQGVASGGLEQTFEYGGKVDQFLILDSGKLGLWDGMTMAMHVETRFGQDVNVDAVGLAPVNVAMLFPNPGEHDTAITGLSFAQAITDDVQATFGKFNALDLLSSINPQSGRGVNGFMNASMVLPLGIARLTPLSFMGAGLMKYRDKQVQGAVMVYDTHNVPTTSGFDGLFDNGANIIGLWRLFTDFGGQPGSIALGGAWSTGEFVAFDPTGFVIVPGQGLVAPRERGAWSVFTIAEQTLWSDRCNKDRNVSLLSQWAISDEATSPFGWTGNVALQAKGLNRSRPHDSVGVGYFYSALSDDFQNLLSPLLVLDDVQGVEVYYNAALTKGFQLGVNLQVIEPADVSLETAVVFGLRGTIGF